MNDAIPADSTAVPLPEKRVLIRSKAAGQRCANLSNMERLRLERLGLFPQRVRISPTIVCYYEDEIDAWINSRIRAAGRMVPKSRAAS